MSRFQQNGYGDAAASGAVRNGVIGPAELEGAVGRHTRQSLADETGRPYDEVVSELSQSLPGAVDQLTPDGRLPTEDEASRWI